MKFLTYAFAALTLFVPTLAPAQTYPSPPQKWGVSTRTMTTNLYFYPAEHAAVARALNTWNSVGPSFKWVDGGLTGYNPTSSSGSRPCDTQSGVGESYNVYSATTAAEARVCTASGTSTITDGDVWVNTTMINDGSFHVGTTAAPYNKLDFETVILHEVGHLLRLLHDNYSTSVVMHESITKGQTKRALHSRDRNGKQTLYP